MEWLIDYIKEDGIVCVKTAGLITWDDNKKMSEEVLSFIRQKGLHRVLIDHRDMIPNLSVLEIDSMPRMFKEIGVSQQDKVAVLYKASSPRESNFLFFQNILRIESLQFKNFTDKAEAIAWLKMED
jgi:hypothetical protein